jgi:hypothetical protein
MMSPSAWSLLTPVTIRRARPEDTAVLAHLAALDSARPLHGDVLLAETEHGPIAALELDDGRATADPFSPSDAAVALLRLRARQLHEAVPARRRRTLAHPLRTLGAGR